jgi:hypothetical protein
MDLSRNWPYQTGIALCLFISSPFPRTSMPHCRFDDVGAIRSPNQNGPPETGCNIADKVIPLSLERCEELAALPHGVDLRHIGLPQRPHAFSLAPAEERVCIGVDATSHGQTLAAGTATSVK